MHPEDLMKADLFSEIVLLGGGGLVFVSLLLIVVTALSRADRVCCVIVSALLGMSSRTATWIGAEARRTSYDAE